MYNTDSCTAHVEGGRNTRLHTGLDWSLIVGSARFQTLGHECKGEQKTSLVSPCWETQQLSSLEGHR